MKIILSFIFWFISAAAFGQLETVNDTSACDFFVLPAINGTGLSSSVGYYTDEKLDGQIYSEGDTVFLSSQIFIVDSINGFSACFYIYIIKDRPIISMPDTIIICGFGRLPLIDGQHVSREAAYFTSRNKMGKKITSGAFIDSSQLLYIYDGRKDCYVEDSLFINVISELPLFTIKDTIACNTFTLPVINNDAMVSNRYYMNLETNLIYNEGQIITESSTLIAIIDSLGCMVSDTFFVNLEPAHIEPISDTTVCQTYSFSLGNFNGNFVSPYLYSSKEDLSYANQYLYINESQLLCVIDSIPNSVCVEKECFNLTILPKAHFPTSLPDTFRVCNISSISLEDIIYTHINEIHLFDIYTTDTNVVIQNGNLLAFNTPLGAYEFMIVARGHEDCIGPTDTLKFIIEVTDQCTFKKAIYKELGCSNFSLRKLYYTDSLIIGGKFYNEDYSLTISENKGISFGSSLTLQFHYVISRFGTSNDTIDIYLSTREVEELIPMAYGNKVLCEGSTFYFSYGDTLAVIWEYDLYLKGNALPLVLGGLAVADNFVSVGFNTQKADVNVLVPNSEYQLILKKVSSNKPCTVNQIVDTIEFSTLSTSHFLLKDTICPYESIMIEGEVFDFNRSKGEIILENAAVNDCDSIIYIDLNFYPKKEHQISYIFCDTTSFIYVNCERYDYFNQKDTQVLTSEQGCDSLILIDLTFSNLTHMDSILYSCEDSLFLNGVSYGNGEIYKDTLHNYLGCDSLILNYTISIYEIEPHYNLEFNCLTNSFDLEVTSEDCLIWINQNNVQSIYNYQKDTINLRVMDTLRNCSTESIITLDYPQATIIGDTIMKLEMGVESRPNLIVNDVPTNFQWVPSSGLSCSTCFIPGITNDENQVYTIYFSNEFGCIDSFLLQTFVYKYENYIHKVCNLDSFIWNNQMYSNPISIIDTLYYLNGCDSLIENHTFEEYPKNPLFIDSYHILCEDDSIILDFILDMQLVTINGSSLEKANYTLNTPGQYAITVIDSFSCKSTYNIEIEAAQSISVYAQDLENTIFTEDLKPLIDYEGPITSYYWSNDENLSCFSCPFPTFLKALNDTYSIVVESQDGCLDSTNFKVTFQSKEFEIPNIIHRNSVNDQNKVLYLNWPIEGIYKLSVFDRWGSLIYNDNSIPFGDISRGWTPSNDLVSGVYVVLIEFEDGLNQKAFKYTTVTIL